MKATMAYNYAKGQWQCWNVFDIDNFIHTPKQIKRLFNDVGNYLHPVIFTPEIKRYEYADGRYTVEFFDDTEFPEVITLEQSIARNKKLLREWTI